MSLPQFQIGLEAGSAVPSPVGVDVMNRLEAVHITETDTGASGFQLRFRAERDVRGSPDYPLMSTSPLDPFDRVRISVSLNGAPSVLMDGFVTHIQVDPVPDTALITVTGEDVSYAMDLIDISFQYPAMPDAVIVGLVLAKYMAIGVLPEIDPTVGTMIPNPLQYIPQQNATDREYLRQLACKHASVFYVEPGPAPGTNTAYFGPPKLSGVPQPALSVDLGPQTNVQRLDFAFDGTRPALYNGMVQDTWLTDMDLPVTTFTSTVEPLATDPALLYSVPFTKHHLFQHPGLSVIDAMIKAQALTDKSTMYPVTADGELDAFRYGHVLRARQLVGVRGAGHRFDGLYYAQTVSHEISPGQYSQKFHLVRGGLGASVPLVSP